MKWRTTGWLVALAVVLFGYVYWLERRSPPSLRPEPALRLLPTAAAEVHRLQLRIANRLVLEAQKTNRVWELTAPLPYLAQEDRIVSYLQLLADATVQKRIPLATAKRGVDEFGLDVPQASLTLYHGEQRTEIQFGQKTPFEDAVYLRLLSSPDICVVSGELYDRLPREANDWRDRSLFPVHGLVIDRLEVQAPGRGFALVVDPTNKIFRLSKPTPARADGPKVEAFCRKIRDARVVRFVSDAPAADLEPYGLQPPVAELILGQGTNDLAAVQFGQSPTNEASLVYARLLGLSNIVLVPKPLIETLQMSHMELRDRHLVTFPPADVDVLECVGAERFTVERQTNGTWVVPGPEPMRADSGLVVDWLDRLSRLEGDIEKDVVSDYATYGLGSPVRRYRLKVSTTNSTGLGTNLVVAELDLGAQQNDRVFARRPDESAVYSLPGAALEGLPTAAWQLRDRQVFHFTTNQIVSVSVHHQGYERKLVRPPSGDWSLTAGASVNPFALEEIMFRLGELRAVAWVDRGNLDRARYGFTNQNYRLTFELKTAGTATNLVVELGGLAPSQCPYALTTLDGQPWVFEFPIALYFEMQRYLSNAPLARSSRD